MRLRAWVQLSFLGLAATGRAVTFTVTFVDPGSAYTSYYSEITSHVQAAGATWVSDLGGSSATNIDVQVAFDPTIQTGDGASATSSYLRTQGGIDVFEQGLAAKLFRGIDANGSAPDVKFDIGVDPANNYLQDHLWFDPNPTIRTAPVDPNRTDAMSFFLHEFTHALGFNGFKDQTNGSLPGNFESTFDQWVNFNGSNFFFTGSAAEAAYGAPVPLTFGNIYHVGNNSPRPGTDLIPDLMNGVEFVNGHRYNVSPLDIAMLHDSEVAVPEPASSCALLVGVALLVRRRRTKPG